MKQTKTRTIRIYPQELKKLRNSIMPNVPLTDAERLKILIQKLLKGELK